MLNQEIASKAIQPVKTGRLKTRPNRRHHGTFWTPRCRWIAGLLVLLSFPLATGCKISKLAVNEALLVSYRDMVWAKRAYTLRYGNCDRPYGEHYYNGFCAGYGDVCNGGDGYVPAIPPTAYRSSRFQSSDGANCVNAWFEGYPAGVAAARQEKVGDFNNVLVSKMIDTAVTNEKNAKRLLPSDVPVASGNGPKAENTAPPDPDAISSVLIPNADLPLHNSPAANKATTADLKHPVNSMKPVSSMNPVSSPPAATSQPLAPKLPPIVTGSGIVRVAREVGEANRTSKPANSNQRLNQY